MWARAQARAPRWARGQSHTGACYVTLGFGGGTMINGPLTLNTGSFQPTLLLFHCFLLGLALVRACGVCCLCEWDDQTQSGPRRTQLWNGYIHQKVHTIKQAIWRWQNLLWGGNRRRKWANWRSELATIKNLRPQRWRRKEGGRIKQQWKLHERRKAGRGSRYDSHENAQVKCSSSELRSEEGFVEGFGKTKWERLYRAKGLVVLFQPLDMAEPFVVCP